MSEMWVFVERRDGKIYKGSKELAAKAKNLSFGKVCGIVFGKDLLDEVERHPFDKIYLFLGEFLDVDYDIYIDGLSMLLRKEKPFAILFSSTPLQEVVSSSLAAKIEAGLTSHCIDVKIKEIDGKKVLSQIVPGFAANMALEIISKTYPQMVMLKEGLFEIREERNKREIEIVELEPPKRRWIHIEEVSHERESFDISSSEVICAGGFGLKDCGFDLVKRLSEVLGGTYAGTRPACDMGWIEEERLIGQSGKTVSPRLFVSVGASGAMHYTTGFSKAKFVLAIDINKNAPIFENCDVGIVGKAEEIVPALIEEISK